MSLSKKEQHLKTGPLPGEYLRRTVRLAVLETLRETCKGACAKNLELSL